MANGKYVKVKKKFLDADIDMLSDDIKVVAVDGADYTPDKSTHEFLSDIPLAGRVAISPVLNGKTTTNGIFKASFVTLPEVTGDQFEYLALFKDSGVAATSPLIYFIDVVASGLPLTPDGADVIIQWNTNGIFSIV